MNAKKFWGLALFLCLIAAIGSRFAFRQNAEGRDSASLSVAAEKLPETIPFAAAQRAATPAHGPSAPPAFEPLTQRELPAVFGLNGSVKLEDVPEGSLRNRLAALSPAARNFALQKLGSLRVPLNDVASLQADDTGHLYYQCAAVSEDTFLAVKASSPKEEGVFAQGSVPQSGSVPIATPPIRHSRPGSTKVIYLDFNGHTITGTVWNTAHGSPSDVDYRPAVASYVAKPFNTDGDATTFSDSEQAAIVRIWERVAEDFFPFDVDVTTEEPASFTPTTGRVLVTNSVDANGVSMPASATAAGVAFLDVFGDADYVSARSPALVYADKEYFYADYIAEAASHEMGHNLSLSHDGLLPISTTNEYYSGHGYGSTSWGPIMGAPYNQSVTQWSKGEYYNANNPQDDLAIIAGHLGYAPSPSTDTNGSAVALSGSLLAQGLIGRTGEADRYSFSTGVSVISFTVSPYGTLSDKTGGNTGLQLQLYNASNTLIASSDSTFNSAGASLSAGVAAGTYYLRVIGSGWGNPTSNPPTGYTAYGSLGQYAVAGTAVAPTVPSFSYPPYSVTVEAGQAVVLSTGYLGNPLPQLKWQRLVSGGSAWVDLSDVAPYSNTTTSSLRIDPATVPLSGDQYRCVATNIAGSATGTSATLTVNPATPPGFYYQPSAQSTTVGSSASFSFGVSGSSPLTFHWQRSAAGSGTWSDLTDGTNYSGTQGGYLNVMNTTLAMDGDKFRCVVTNIAGTATTNAAVLTVTPVIAPGISGMPATLTFNYGDNAYMNPTITGTAPFTVQWYKNGVTLAGYNSQYFSKYGVTTADSGSYTMTATNSAGTATSSPVIVTINAPILPAISLQPTSVEAGKGYSAAFNVVANGSPQLLFQWYKDGQPIQYATYSNYSIGSVQLADSGHYSVRITNDAGSVTSQEVELTVLPAVLPTISLPAGTVTISSAYPYINLNATVTGTPPLTYQWYRDNVAIAGANSPYLFSGSGNSSSAGNYTLQATNEAGTAMSPDVRVVWSNGIVTPWLDSVQLGHIVYFLATSPGRIMRYNLDQESWLPIVYLPEAKVPTAFLPTAEGIFIAYNHDLVWRSLDLIGNTETPVSSSGSTITMLFARGDMIYYADGTTMKLFDRNTLAARMTFTLPYTWLNIGGGLARHARPAMMSTAAVGFTTRPSVSPDDIIEFSFAVDGSIPSCTDSPYHGSFVVGNRQYLSPDEKLLFDNSGVIYATSDITFSGSVGRAFDDMVFRSDGSPVMLRDKTLHLQNGSGYSVTATYELGASNYAVYAVGNTIFSFAAPTSNTTNPIVTKVAATAFSVPVPGRRDSPVNRMFSVEDAFIDSHHIIHLISRTEQGIIRWDTQTRAFRSTLSLKGRPAFTSYAPAIDRLAVAYGYGELTDFFLGADGTEQGFGNIPATGSPMSLVAMDDQTFADAGPYLHFVINSLGELTYLSANYFNATGGAWSSVNRRLYFPSQDVYSNAASYISVSPSGSLGNQTTTANSIYSPMRFSPDETLILAGSKVVNADLQSVGTLANSVADGVWLPDGLYTIRPRPTGTEVQKWTRITYTKTGSLVVKGIPLRIFKEDDKTVAVVSLVNGYVAFSLISSDLVVTSFAVNSTAAAVTHGLGDFDGDGKADLIWSNATTGDRSMWFLNGNTTSAGATLGMIPAAWVVSATADFDGDGKADIFWTNTVTGDRAVWLMNGSAMRTNTFMGTIPNDWVISGTGDFNGDGKADLVWTNSVTGDRAMWLMNGSTVTGGGYLGTVPVAWTISGVGDFNGDGKADLVWSNVVTGERSMWFQNGSTTVSGATLNTIPATWVIAGVGDFNGDGKADIFLSNTTTGDRVIWLMNGSTIVTNTFMGTVPVDWVISGTGDFNGDGKKDLFWTNTATGDRAMWLLNGSTVTGGGYMGTVPVVWKINE